MDKLRKIIFKMQIKGRILERKLYIPRELIEFCEFKKGERLFFVEEKDKFFISRIQFKYALSSSLYNVGASKSSMIIIPKGILTRFELNDDIYCYSVDTDAIWFVKEAKK